MSANLLVSEIATARFAVTKARDKEAGLLAAAKAAQILAESLEGAASTYGRQYAAVNTPLLADVNLAAEAARRTSNSYFAQANLAADEVERAEATLAERVAEREQTDLYRAYDDAFTEAQADEERRSGRIRTLGLIAQAEADLVTDLLGDGPRCEHCERGATYCPRHGY